MPLIVPGSMQIGPRPSGSSAPSTLPAYLTSIGKDSFYARFVAGTNMYVNSDKTGGAVSIDNLVGSWDYDAANTSNWSAYWTQATSGNRPYYKTAGGVNSLYAPSNDTATDADTRHMQLSSTSQLNGTYSIFVKCPLLARDTRAVFSHNISQCAILSSSGSSQLLTLFSNNSSTADQLINVVRNSPGTSSGVTLIGLSQTGTGHNGVAPYLLRRTSNYSWSAISEIWFTPQLTAAELDAAMTFIT